MNYDIKCNLPILTDNFNKPEVKQFNLAEIYTVDYSTIETIIEAAAKINSWYGFFNNLLPQIGKKRDIIAGNIDKLGEELKQTKANTFIRCKTGDYEIKDVNGNVLKVTDTLAKEHKEIDADVMLVKAEINKENELLINVVENLNTVKGVINTLTYIQEQIKSFSYVRRHDINESSNLDNNLMESMQRKG